MNTIATDIVLHNYHAIYSMVIAYYIYAMMIIMRDNTDVRDKLVAETSSWVFSQIVKL